MNIPSDAQILFHFNDVSVKARPAFWGMLALMWGFFAWLAGRRRPRRPWSESLLVGALSLLPALFADIGHALAHSVSAKAAGAPMDTVLLDANMPRTLYADNDVPPHVHRTRALGGPIFNALGLSLSLLWRKFSPPRTESRELADISAVAHGMLFFGSLFPIPIIDGGTILKWTLVERGCTEDEADQRVRQAGLGAGLALGGIAAILLPLFLKRRAT
jgi:hypothetical protein